MLHLFSFKKIWHSFYFSAFFTYWKVKMQSTKQNPDKRKVSYRNLGNLWKAWQGCTFEFKSSIMCYKYLWNTWLARSWQYWSLIGPDNISQQSGSGRGKANSGWTIEHHLVILIVRWHWNRVSVVIKFWLKHGDSDTITLIAAVQRDICPTSRHCFRWWWTISRTGPRTRRLVSWGTGPHTSLWTTGQLTRQRRPARRRRRRPSRSQPLRSSTANLTQQDNILAGKTKFKIEQKWNYKKVFIFC